LTLIEPNKALKDLSSIEKILEGHLGPGVFAPEKAVDIPRVTCGIEVINQLLGGGLPTGMILEIFGPESTGKTTFCTQVAAATQPLGFRWLYLDFEQTFNMVYASKGLGLDTKKPNFILSQPRTIEEGVLLSRVLIERDLVNGVIWDTPAASQPAALINGTAFDTNSQLGAAYREIGKGKTPTSGRIAGHASVFSEGISSLVGLIAQKDVLYLIPNQIRTTINDWGAGETTSGGRALKFYAATRIRLSKKETKKFAVDNSYFGTSRQEAGENLVQFHVVKNKTAPPFRMWDVRLAYGRGFLDVETLVDLAQKRKSTSDPDKKVIEKSGAYFVIPGQTEKIYGTEALYKHYYDNPASFDVLKMEIRNTQPDGDEYAEPDAADLVTEDEVPELAEGKTKF
jgi:recombination protein RecA